VVATGENWPDALAGGPLASTLSAPILLTRRYELPAPCASVITTIGATSAVILGGTSVVDPAVEDDLIDAGINPGSITRIAGANRYETAAKIAEFIENHDMNDVDTAYFATGANFPDALAAGPFGGAFRRPILLVKRDEIPAYTQQAITGLGLTTSYVLGGTGVISADVMSQLPFATRLGGADRYETAAIIAEHGLLAGGSSSVLYTATGQSFPDALAAAPLAAFGPYPIVPLKRDSVPAASMTYLTTHESSILSWYMLGGEAAVSEATEQAVFDVLNP